MDGMSPMSAPQNAASARAGVTTRATAQAFEAVFLGQVTQLMLENAGNSGFSGGHGEEMFRGVLAEQIGTAIAARGGVGLAPLVLDQIIRLQGETGHAG